MRPIKQMLAAYFLSLAFGGCKADQNISGEWYGLQDNSLLTVRFNGAKSLEVESEAFSGLTFSGSYALNADARPIEIDLPQASNGLAGAGILRNNPDGSLEMNINFGAPGSIKRPARFGADPSEMTNIYFNLTRDKEALLAPLAVDYEIPDEARKAFARNARLGTGINLNGVADGNLHPGYERDAPLSDEEIKEIADAGFESIRFDICWVKHCDSIRPYTIEPAFFDKIDHIVNECINHNMAVSIDQHYYPHINMGQPATPEQYEENFVRLDSLWSQIAYHYKDYPNDMLFFDLLNEPNTVLGADKWNETIASLLKTIRATNPDRTVIVQTPNLGQAWTLNCLELPLDDWNIIVEFHYYLPHTFTHQGLSYAMAGDCGGVEWKGTDQEKESIIHDLDFCSRWSIQHGRPLNMGEWGTVNTADPDSRVRYHRFICEQNRGRGFSSHMWGYREPFMIRSEKSGEWEKTILDAMFDENQRY